MGRGGLPLPPWKRIPGRLYGQWWEETTNLLNFRSARRICWKGGRSWGSSAQHLCISCPSSSRWLCRAMEGRNGGCSPRVTRSMISVWEGVCTEEWCYQGPSWATSWGRWGKSRPRAQSGLVTVSHGAKDSG